MSSPPSDAQFQFGPFRLDAAQRTLTRGIERVPVTARAFDVLLALVERAGETVDKDELLDIVWPGAVVEESNLTQQVFTIRRLLGGRPGDAGYIVTVPRRGYRFVSPVSRAQMPLNRARDPVSSRTIRLAMPLPCGAPLATGAESVLTISPDGRTIVYVAAGQFPPRLYRRGLDMFDATPIPATEGAGNPFFSPDGEWIGFTAGNRLLKMPAAGGPPQAICDISGAVRGATWMPSGVIVFAPSPAAALWQVHADGGTPSPLTTLRFDDGERTHRWPHRLADGAGVLFTIGHADAGSFDEASLAVVEFGEARHRIVLHHATDGRLVGNTVLCGRQGNLLAAAFDPLKRDVLAAPRVVLSGVAMSPTGAVHAAFSGTGVLVHAPGQVQASGRRLLTLALDGRILNAIESDDAIEEPRVSPDGRSALVGRRGRGCDLWLHDCARGSFRRLTFDEKSFAGIWGPEPGGVTCSSNSSGVADLYRLEAERGVEASLLLQTEFDKVPGAWSPDGATLAYTEYHPETGADIWILSRGTGQTRPLVRTRFNEYGPRFSPDGRHVAYTCDESGRPEVYVVSPTDGSGKCQVSVDGGAEPVWSPDGRALFYRVGHRMVRVDVSPGPHRAGVPVTLFEQHHVPGAMTGLANYDVGLVDGTFLVVVDREVPATVLLHVTLGMAELA